MVKHLLLMSNLFEAWKLCSELMAIIYCVKSLLLNVENPLTHGVNK